MERPEERRINEALDLLNAAARDKKAELQAAMETKYTDLSAVVSAFAGTIGSRAADQYEAGKRKVVDMATTVNKSVHTNPWAYVGGAAVGATIVGYMLGRSHKSKP